MSLIRFRLQPGSRKEAWLAAAVSVCLWGTSAIAAPPTPNTLAPPAQEELDSDFISSLAELADLDVARQTESAQSAQGPYSEVETIRERYPNRRVKVEREVTLDSDGNYVNHGTWKMWNQGGKLVAEGQFNMGQRVGVWTRWHTREDAKALDEYPFNRFQPPFVSQATFNNGELDGDWVIFDASQQKCSLVSFQKGLREGPAILWLPGGQVLREASYSQNVPVGDVLERDKNGKVTKVAAYVDGRKVVSKSSVFPGTKDKRTEAVFLSPQTALVSPDDFWSMKFAKFDTKGDEIRHGPWKTWYTNGQVQLEGYYQLDKEVGTFTWWHENGQKAVQGEYTDGRQNSLWIWWHNNGQVASRGEYRTGAKIGQWRRWAADGRLEQQAMFDPKTPDSQQTPEQLEFSKNVPVLPWLSR